MSLHPPPTRPFGVYQHMIAGASDTYISNLVPISIGAALHFKELITKPFFC